MTGTPSPSEPAHSGSLALAFQEVFTTVVRIRAAGASKDHEYGGVRAQRARVADAGAFRSYMRDAITQAVAESKRYYTDTDIELALLAAVGFLDESILNSGDPVFADWQRDTLCNELFGHQHAGQIFFDNLNKLRTAPDSPAVASVLEVYRLCLLLGFRGKIVDPDRVKLKALADAAGKKIARARGYSQTLFPEEPVIEERPVAIPADPWNRRWLVVAVVCICLAGALFAGFDIALDSGVSKLQTLSEGLPG